MTDAVRTEFDAAGAIARIVLNRPEKHNALNDPLVEGLGEALNEVERDPDVRVVVLTGAGDTFCAGGDIERMNRRHETGITTAETRRGLRFEHRDTVRTIFGLDKPVIARVEGAAVGAGADLAIACDIVLGAEDARFGWVFRNVGMSVDFGGSFLLPNLVGLRRAKELLFSGEPISGADAADEGLITDAVPAERLDDAVGDWTNRLVDAPTEALVLAKQAVTHGATSTFAEAIERETLVQSVLYNTRDHEEGVSAFLEGRDPEFEGR